jgi:L1 cell adhesion molecule like protein
MVPLGVLLKNETKHDEMVSILESLQRYVPIYSQEETFVDPEDNEEMLLTLDVFHYLLFGGDQLTVERANGSKRGRDNESRGKDRLEGLMPVIEDWHAKVCFLKVCMLLEFTSKY